VLTSEPTVLLVDDDSRYLDLLELHLESLDVEVRRAESAEEALKLMKAEPPDLVVSDIQMPGMHGAALKHQSRRSARARNVPFLFVTGALRNGGDPGAARTIVSKTAGPEVVIERVRETLALDADVAVAASTETYSRTRAFRRRAKWALERAAYRLVRRTLDLVAAGGALVMFAPLLCLIATAVKLQDLGPVLSTRTLIGKGGRRFRLYSFRITGRSAAADATTDQDAQLRLTRVGSLLKMSGLDTLPVLWNIYFGDLTLVGPRAARPAETVDYTQSHWARLDVTPGLLNPWSLPDDSPVSLERRVELDLDYIQKQSLLFDLSVVFRMTPATSAHTSAAAPSVCEVEA